MRSLANKVLAPLVHVPSGTGDGVAGSRVDVAWLTRHADAWDALVSGALGPTAYYARRTVTAHHEAGLAPGLAALAVREGAALRALLPFRPGGARIGWRRAHAAWTSPYTTASTPLVASRDPDEAVASLLDAMAAEGPLWVLPRFTPEDETGRLLMATLERRGWPHAVLSPFRRAVLDRRPSVASFEASLPAGLRKDLRRRWRRIGRGREVRLDTVAAPPFGPALDSFLDLERSGWKGRAGSALASRPATAALARRLLDDAPDGVAPRIDRLLVDGRPVAASIALVAGRTAYLWKAAYDERFAPYAPGILLEDAIAHALHATGFADRLDSAAEPGSPLDRLFADREAVGDLVLATGEDAGFERLVAVERGVRRGIEMAKRGRAVLRGR